MRGGARPAHRVGWVDIEDMADNEPVEKHPERSEMLFDGLPSDTAGGPPRRTLS